MSQLIPLLTAFGLGSVMTALIQNLLALRSQRLERSFKERQAAYIGLLEAYHQAAVTGSPEAAKNFAYWQIRCDIVAPHSVRTAIEHIVKTNDDPVGRSHAHSELKTAMRADLAISK